MTKPGAELAAAVPALAALCRSFTAFGTRRMIPEQTAAIEALAIIGGREAAHAVLEMIERAAVQGLGLQLAVSAAARLGSVLSQDALCQLLRHAEPRIRADACRCARPLPELILLLIDLLDDLDQGVATSAACALGRMGRIEARGRLESLLRDDPSEDVIDATSPIADEECAVLLGRIARSGSVLADAALLVWRTSTMPVPSSLRLQSAACDRQRRSRVMTRASCIQANALKLCQNRKDRCRLGFDLDLADHFAGLIDDATLVSFTETSNPT